MLFIYAVLQPYHKINSESLALQLNVIHPLSLFVSPCDKDNPSDDNITMNSLQDDCSRTDIYLSYDQLFFLLDG